VKRLVKVLASIVAIFALGAFVPGSENYFVNASRDVLAVECRTMSQTYKAMAVAKGSRLGLSGDYSELIELTVKYAEARPIRLKKQDIDQLKATSHLKHGVWWINDSGVEYISGRDANIRQRQLTGGRL